MVEEGSTHPTGEALLEELLWVHSIIRSNLDTIKSLIEQVAGGAPASQVRAQIEELASTSVVWRLRVDCMRYCHLVHTHHRLEDVAFFPTLCRLNPAIRQVVDKLQADHLQVSDYLDAVESAASRIMADESARADLSRALSELSDHLLAHLDYEETNLAPTLRRIREFRLG